jgi:hypothetical protein
LRDRFRQDGFKLVEIGELIATRRPFAVRRGARKILTPWFALFTFWKVRILKVHGRIMSAAVS